MSFENRTIKILFAEDLPEDFELAKATLKRGGILFEGVRVDTQDDFVSELQQFDPQIIISDYSMPTFNGMEALELAKSNTPDIPFILLTGSINEETAVKCMKAGATDYVLKERMARLPFAVKEAIEQAQNKLERKMALRALRESEEKFRMIAENAHDFIFKIEYKPVLRFAYASPSATRITGYTPEEFYKTPRLSVDIIHPDDREKFRNLRKLKKEGKSLLTYRIIKKSGDEAYLEQINVFTYDKKKRTVALDAVARDITDRVKAQEALAQSEAQYRVLFESNPNPMWVYDTDSLKFLAVNNIAIENYGYSMEEFLSMTIGQIRPTEQLPRLKNNIDNVEDEIQHSGPWVHQYKNGKRIFAEITSHSIDYNGRPARLVVAYNVTDRVEATQKLYEQKQIAQATLDSINANICLLDGQGTIVSVNKHWIDFALESKASLDEVGVGNNYFTVCQRATSADAEDANNMIKGMQMVLSGQTSLFEMEYKMTLPEANKWFQVRVVPYMGHDRLGQGLVISHIDITPKKIAEIELQESELRYRIFMNSTQDMAFLKDEEFKYIMVNRSGLGFFERKEFEVLGHTDFDLLPHSVANSSSLSDKKAIEKGMVVINTELYNDKIYETRKFPVKLSNGKIGIGGFIRDVTDWHNAQKAIKDSEKKYKSLVENSLVGVYTTSITGEFLFANQAMATILEFNSIPELMQTNIKVLYKNPQEREELIHILKTQDRFKDFELEFITPKGNIKYVMLSASIAGKTMSGMLMDITSRKTAELEVIENNKKIEAQNEELEAAKLKAEENDRLKTAFLQNLSHEIRTPMNGIMGFTELLKDGSVSKETNDFYLDMIEQSGERMMNIINDLIEISKIETGQTSLYISQFNIDTVLLELQMFYKKIAEEKGVELRLGQIDSAKDVSLTSDRGKIYQIISNLINNALKFTSEGVVEFGYSLPNQSEVEFFVKDTGIGISPEYQELIFERFRQIDTSISRGYEGSGLGLSISKAFVEKLDGKIWVTSEPEKGSTFKFSIPIK
jgi:PAS domain S-box-containing protein